MTVLSPTQDQQQALTKILAWLTEEKSPAQFLLEGYAGCGKTTLINFVLEAIKNSSVLSKKYESIYLTATTNKAVDALRENIDLSAVTDTVTIHTFLNLYTVKTSAYSRFSTLKKKKNETYSVPSHSALIVIDEVSYIDYGLWYYIMSYIRSTSHVKILFMGDSAQLISPSNQKSKVFLQDYPSYLLKEVFRQVNKPSAITTMIKALREKILDSTLEFPRLKIDNKEFYKLASEDELIDIYKEGLLNNKLVKTLCWTNAKSISYNNHIRKNLFDEKEPLFNPHDYVSVNNFFPGHLYGVETLKTDEEVYLQDVSKSFIVLKPINEYIPSIEVYTFTIKNCEYVMPVVFKWKKELRQRVRQFISNEEERQAYYTYIEELEETYIDIRHSYSCTINKAQGSTYDIVIIDLKDVSKTKEEEHLLRLLYVAISRAREAVYFINDIATS